MGHKLAKRYTDWAVAIWIVFGSFLFLSPYVSVNLGFHDLAELSLNLRLLARYTYLIVFSVCLVYAAIRGIRRLGEMRDN